MAAMRPQAAPALSSATRDSARDATGNRQSNRQTRARSGETLRETFLYWIIGGAEAPRGLKPALRFYSQARNHSRNSSSAACVPQSYQCARLLGGYSGLRPASPGAVERDQLAH